MGTPCCVSCGGCDGMDEHDKGLCPECITNGQFLCMTCDKVMCAFDGDLRFSHKYPYNPDLTMDCIEICDECYQFKCEYCEKCIEVDTNYVVYEDDGDEYLCCCDCPVKLKSIVRLVLAEHPQREVIEFKKTK